MKKNTVIALIVFIAFALLLFAFVPPPASVMNDAPESQAMLPQPFTVSGTQICLPHKDTEGPQTKECALGFKGDDGRNYALNLAGLDEGATAPLYAGSRVEITGIYTPIELLSSDQWMTYDTAGILSAESIRAL